MSIEAAMGAAREGQLYPAVILHGGDPSTRQETVVELARILLCAEPAGRRPCGACTHCRRIAWPDPGGEIFHPDFRVLERDLKTATSVGAVKELLRGAQLPPFEARGQVFVIASAETLTGEAANALLKTLEEPHTTAPRHFFLLTPSRLDLLPTLRSRSLGLYLGSATRLAPDEIAPLAEAFGRCVLAYGDSEAPVYLLAAAQALASAGGWEDPRASHPWALAARAVLAARDEAELPDALRRPLLSLAEELLGGPRMRVRGIAAERILEGLVSRHLGKGRQYRFC